jgi:hypothetical protein
MYGQLTLLVIASIVGPTTIAIAVAVLAVVIVLGGVLVFRSGKGKGSKPANTMGQTDWQRQSQQSGVGMWNQQAMGTMNNDAPSWAQQGGQGFQNQGQGIQGSQSNWNNQGMMQQNAWGAGSDGQNQAPSWNPQNNQVQQAQQPAWMQGVQQNSAPSWNMQGGQGNPGNPAQQAAATGWGNQGFQTTPSPAPVQDNWGMQQQGMQQPQTGFNGGSSAPSWNGAGFGGMQDGQANLRGAPQTQYAQGSNNAMDGFSAAPAFNAPQQAQAAQAPIWQQGGFGQNEMGMGMSQGQGNMGGGNAAGRQMPFAAENAMLGGVDNDRTIIRPAGSGLGVVRVEEGKDPGREFEIRKESLSIGRSRESDIFLEDLAVSRLHASILNQGNGNYVLKDEGSANGTKVNGQLVGKYQTYPLQEGDRVQLGQTVLAFSRR